MPPLARSQVDRAAHRRTDSQWLARAWSTAWVLLVDTAAGGVAPIRDSPDGPVLALVPAAEVPETDPARRLFLGVAEGDVALFAIDGRLTPPAGTRAANLREVGGALNAHDAGLFTSAVALANWHARHAFSPRTGQPTIISDGGWSRREPDGGQLWPRTDPAVITLVHDGGQGPDGRCLLGHGAAWLQPGGRRFSCLAGFVEAGESAETAVAREICEEVGVRVDRITYVGSQAWPFPGSLMLGFLARADPAQPIRVDGAEISEARWFSRREIAAASAGERVELGDGDELLLPAAASIASYLVSCWLGDDAVGLCA